MDFKDLKWTEPKAMRFYSEVNDGGEIVAVWQLNGETKFRKAEGWDFAHRITPETQARFQLFSDGYMTTNGKWREAMDCNEAAIWAERENFAKIRAVDVRGHGYSGGHNTAARLGWSTYIPPAKVESVMHQDVTRQGRFTGYYPATRSYVPA